ncbi:hypothetical protein AW736_23905 [Termitidicoccus mucosus]|uniref:Uncharacterized protein n=1 Tax=Termitidicoccus mucosus TaxID=1184151 RepID=A0A178IB95_9BACT|nr:hypothetical protein AW736_23905 [Opitutaceae bacterium TSB47]
MQPAQRPLVIPRPPPGAFGRVPVPPGLLVGLIPIALQPVEPADAAAGRGRDATGRANLRARHFARSLRWLHALALGWRERSRPKSGLGAASGYLLAQWAPLSRHVGHGQTRLDNNLVENAIRPTALGKKNWLFIGHPDAGRRAAILYSIIVSCLRHGKDPAAYLRDVLSRLPSMTNQDDLEAITPRRWQPASAFSS